VVHPGLAHFESSEEGRAWLARLPKLLMDCEDAWELTPAGQPFEYAHASLALPVKDRGGADAVLKIQFPHRECEHEGDALALWNGEGAVQLLVRSFERSALLLERCFPGTPLSSRDADYALNILIDLLPRLWKPAGEPFTTLADEAAWWLSYLPESWERAGQPCERRLLDAALDALRGLPPTQGEQVLLHQDLHGDNVLAAEREPWLVIDPKPLVGEREFGVAPIVRSFELGEGRRDVLGRFERLTSELQLDVERARGWTIGQTLAWAFDGGEASSWHLQVAAWLFETA
jgi:streptomycin 6-kinase